MSFHVWLLGDLVPHCGTIVFGEGTIIGGDILVV